MTEYNITAKGTERKKKKLKKIEEEKKNYK